MRYLVISALPYVNAIPHLGNLTGSILPADVYYKYLKMDGQDAIYICGSDQHGTPIELRAIKNGVPAEQLADELHEKVKELFAQFEMTFTYYGKTHTKESQDIVDENFGALDKNGYIVEVESVQGYCNFDKRFLTDRFIEGKCPYCGGRGRGDQCDDCGKLLTPQQLIEPFCAICGKKEVTFKKVKNLALALDKLQGGIESFIKQNSKNNWTKNAINKPLSYVKEGLKPRDITRNMKWGLSVPKKGYEESVFYVWFEALQGYISITKAWDQKRWLDYWKGKDVKVVNFMGKDNIEFHTLMWPGILLGSGLGYNLPTTIRASEYLNAVGVKFSKSRGVGLNIETALSIMEPDYWRFALMYLYPETADTEFTLDGFKDIINNILNDKIGNLAQRVLKLSRSNESLISGDPRVHDDYKVQMDKLLDAYRASFEKADIREALRAVVELAGVGNSIMSAKEPWALVKKDREAFTDTMSTLTCIVYDIAIMLWPFTPKASMQLLRHFGITGEPSLAMIHHRVRLDLSNEPQPLFHKITKEEDAKLKETAG